MVDDGVRDEQISRMERALDDLCPELIGESRSPDTWLPTSTVVTACSVPVATITRSIGPDVTGAVVTSTRVVSPNAQTTSVTKLTAIAPMPIAVLRVMDHLCHPLDTRGRSSW
jgi:hypothetical protein